MGRPCAFIYRRFKRDLLQPIRRVPMDGAPLCCATASTPTGWSFMVTLRKFNSGTRRRIAM